MQSTPNSLGREKKYDPNDHWNALSVSSFYSFCFPSSACSGRICRLAAAEEVGESYCLPASPPSFSLSACQSVCLPVCLARSPSPPCHLLCLPLLSPPLLPPTTTSTLSFSLIPAHNDGKAEQEKSMDVLHALLSLV